MCVSVKLASSVGWDGKAGPGWSPEGVGSGPCQRALVSLPSRVLGQSEVMPVGEWSFMSILKRNYLLGVLALTFQVKIHCYCWQRCPILSLFSTWLWDLIFLIAGKMNLNHFSYSLSAFLLFWGERAVCSWLRLSSYRSSCKICTMALMLGIKSSISKFPWFKLAVF